ncbi:MAG TPA: endonuclease III [Alphaproteobacteria bacterium]|nr:endonuclease III [Alphaproteobacteria bacterium]
MNKESASQFFKRLAARLPQPKTELVYTSPYTLLVAVILSAQATDAGVNKATKDLFKTASTPEAMVKLGLNGLKRFIKTIGLYRGKAKNIIAMSELLLERHGGQVPRSREDLESLPGVGRKSANVILNTVYGDPVIAVDTHVFRVANRTGLAPGKTVLEVEEKLLKAVPEKYLPHAHHWLVLHGRYVCKARVPECPICPVADVCAYPNKTKELPALKRGAGVIPQPSARKR